MFRISCVLPLLCFAGSALATTYSEFDTTRPLSCEVSAKHQNRIVIEDGRIKKAIFPDGHLQVRLEEESGQAFVCLQEPGSSPVTMSVITDDGRVQDLELAFGDRPAEVVILVEPHRTEGESWFVDPRECGLQNISNVVHSVLNRAIPVDYSFSRVAPASRYLRAGVKLMPIACLESGEELVYVYWIANVSRRPKEVNEIELSRGACKWAYLGHHCLQPRQVTLALVAFNKA